MRALTNPVLSGQPFPRRPLRVGVQSLATIAIVAAAAILASMCGGSTAVTNVAGPSSARCQTTLAAEPTTVSPDGGRVTVTVASARDCTWTVAADVPWMQLSTTSGQGEGTVTAIVARNEQPNARTGALTVNDQRVSVTQEPRPCAYELQTASARMSHEGGRGTIELITSTGCTWTAASTASWLRVLTASGTGAATIDFEAAANTGLQREAAITIANQRFVIVQVASADDQTPGPPQPNCAATLRPTSLNVDTAGGAFMVNLEIGPACGWTASASESWLSLKPSDGHGNAAITISVERNTGVARSATVTIAGQRMPLYQAEVCSFTLEPSALNFAAAGGEGRVRVNTQAGCQWTAGSGAPWVVVSTSSATGPGEVVYNVQANTTASPRSTTINVSGQTHTISQAAASTCTYSIAPASLNFAATGGEGRVTVTTQAGCAWSASSGAGWAVVTTGAGTGSGEVVYTVLANTVTSPRSTTITIAGQSHGVTQAAAPPTCSYSIAPASRNFAAAGGEGRVTVTTQPGCTWSASSGAGWVGITTGSGTGSGEAVYRVQANTATSTRSTTITVAGQSHAVTQDAAPPCSYSIAPASRNFAAAGGEGRVTVTTQAGCTWSASGGAGWVTITTGSGTGSGDAVYSVQANTATSTRSTSITVAGQSHTVTQDAAPPPCTYNISPGSLSFTAAGGEGRVRVTTQAGCTWSASSGAAWAALTSGSGTGTGDMVYVVQINTAATARSTSITVAGQTHSVSQAAAP